jgi:hypothetical protein
MKDCSLYYWGRRLDEAEVVRLLEQAWNELYDMEYEGAFGAWRGIHLEAETGQVHITFDTMFSGPPLMVTLSRTQGFIRIDYRRDEFLELEQAAIERIRNLPPGKG